jgi:hypothetical protein
VNYVTEEVEDGTYEFVCAKCHQPLDRWYTGEWVAKYPDRKAIRGYHISQLNAVWISADDVMRRQFKYRSKQLFMNYVIGLPFASEGLIITDDDVLASQRYMEPIGHKAGYKFTVAGIDWGLMNWCVLLGVKEDGQVDLLNLWWFKDNPTKPLEPVAQIALVLQPYNPDLIIADFGYGADRNTYLMQMFMGKTWACKFVTIKNGSQVMDKWTDAAKQVTVDKTVKVQRLLHTVKAHQIGMWHFDEKLAMLTKHLKNVRIMDEEDEETGQVYQIATRIGDDHLAMATTYALLGVEKLKGVYVPKQEFLYDFM